MAGSIRRMVFYVKAMLDIYDRGLYFMQQVIRPLSLQINPQYAEATIQISRADN
jgi:hypothetical protein